MEILKILRAADLYLGDVMSRFSRQRLLLVCRVISGAGISADAILLMLDDDELFDARLKLGYFEQSLPWCWWAAYKDSRDRIDRWRAERKKLDAYFVQRGNLTRGDRLWPADKDVI